MTTIEVYFGFSAITLIVWNGVKILTHLTNTLQNKDYTANVNLNTALIIVGILTLYSLSIAPHSNAGKEINKEPEYDLEIINQNKVKITSNDTKKVYYCPLNKIDRVLIKDNL